MKIIVLLLLICLQLLSFGQAKIKNHPVKPKGVYAEIDVKRHNQAINILKGDDNDEKQEMVNKILSKPNDYNPIVIHALAAELFRINKKDEAIFWFYVGQFRANYDGKLSLETEVRDVTMILWDQYGQDILNYALNDLNKTKNSINKAVEFVKTNEEMYDNRWVNLRSMGAIMSGLNEKEENEKQELSEPKEKWPEIKKKSIEEFYNQWITFIDSDKK